MHKQIQQKQKNRKHLAHKNHNLAPQFQLVSAITVQAKLTNLAIISWFVLFPNNLTLMYIKSDLILVCFRDGTSPLLPVCTQLSPGVLAASGAIR